MYYFCFTILMGRGLSYHNNYHFTDQGTNIGSVTMAIQIMLARTRKIAKDLEIKWTCHETDMKQNSINHLTSINPGFDY